MVGDEAERGLCINRKGTLNIPIVFIMQTTVNKLKKKKNLAGGTAPKIACLQGNIGLKQLNPCCPYRRGVSRMSYWFAAGRTRLYAGEQKDKTDTKGVVGL